MRGKKKEKETTKRRKEKGMEGPNGKEEGRREPEPRGRIRGRSQGNITPLKKLRWRKGKKEDSGGKNERKNEGRQN